MQNRKRNSRGILYSLLIIVISFVYAINIQPVVFGEPSCLSNTFRSNQCDSSNEISDFLAISSPLPQKCDENGYYLGEESKTLPEKTTFHFSRGLNSKISINEYLNFKDILASENEIILSEVFG